MKKIVLCVVVLTLITSCGVSKEVSSYPSNAYAIENESISQSLFNDKNATISEENIQKILDGSFKLPENLRVAFVKLESAQHRGRYFGSDETFLKNQQSYLDLFEKNFKNSGRIKSTKTLPDVLISNNPTFTSIREAAVRTQSDIAVIYSINSDLYSKYKMFSKTEIKAFATTQLIILDVKTGLIPFTTIVTKESQSNKKEGELNDSEAANRVKNEAVLQTINEIGNQINDFLKR